MGVYIHARPSGEALVSYRLGGRFDTFRSEAVVPVMLPHQENPGTPLVFKVQGDGRTLWRSKPLAGKGDHQPCSVSVKGVDELSLIVECGGSESWGLAAWIEPRLSTSGAEPVKAEAQPPTPPAVDLQAQGPTSDEDLFPNVLPREIECKVGPQHTLIPDGAFGLHYFPDGPISIVSPRPFRFLMVCGNETVLFAGQGFGDSAPQAKILSPGGGPDSHYAGVYGVWKDERRNRTLGVYHAEDHEGIGKIGANGVNGFYGTVCLAAYNPGDERLDRLGPIITGDRPKRPVGGPDAHLLICQGVGEPHVVADRDGKNLLCFYTEWGNRKERHVSICTARSPLDAGGAPGSWTKFHRGDFGEPGLGGHDSPVLACGPGDVSQPQVTHVRAWDRYLLVFAALVFDEFGRGRPVRSGLYAATSQDGVRWTEPQRLVTMLTVFKTGLATVQHPTLLVDDVKGDRLQGRLLYAFTPMWPTPHHLVSRPVTIRLKAW